MFKGCEAYHGTITAYTALSGDPEEQAGWRSRYIGRSGIICIFHVTNGEIMRFLETDYREKTLFMGLKLTTSRGQFHVEDDGETAYIITHNSRYDLRLYKRLDGASPDELTEEQQVYQNVVQGSNLGLQEQNGKPPITTHDVLRGVANIVLPGREQEFLQYLMHSMLDDHSLLQTGPYVYEDRVIADRPVDTAVELLVALKEPLTAYINGAPFAEPDPDSPRVMLTKFQLQVYMYRMSDDAAREKAWRDSQAQGYTTYKQIGVID